MMPEQMHSFLRQHRSELLARWEARIRAALPVETTLTHEQLRDSLPLFLDEIIEGLGRMSGKLVEDQQSALARVHGGQREHLQQNIAELVREYGLFYEAVVQLSVEVNTALSQAGLVGLSNCLFSGAAEAVEEFAVRASTRQRQEELQHFGFLAHEIRNPLWSARLAWDAIQRLQPLAGKHVEMLNRSLSRVATLLDETLSAARLARLSEMPESATTETVDVAALLTDAEQDSSGDAEHKKVGLLLETGPALTVRGDYRLLLSALTNVVRNAVKYTHAGGTVILRRRLHQGRVLIEVQDECGGLPPERAEQLFEVFTQAHQNRSGFGLGLAIAKQAVEAQGGTVSVKNVPNSGCIFILDLRPAT